MLSEASTLLPAARPRSLARGVLVLAALGLLAAAALIAPVYRIPNGRELLQRASDAGRLKSRQMSSIAAGHSRIAKARFSMLLGNDTFSEAGYLPSYATNGTEMLAVSTSADVEYDCGGQASGQICFDAAQACISSAESLVSNLYLVDPISATQNRKQSVCKCFVSNGCTPACNVALYTLWADRSGEVNKRPQPALEIPSCVPSCSESWVAVNDPQLGSKNVEVLRCW